MNPTLAEQRTRRRANRARSLSQPRNPLLAALTALALAGCAAPGSFTSGAMTITVKPGQTGTCAITPCRILLEMPAGSGSYRVTGNQVDF